MLKQLTHYHKQYKEIGYRDRTMLISIGSFTINALIGTGKLVLGIVIFSPWFIVTAIYYLLLCGARGQLLWRFRQTRTIENPIERFEKQFSVFRHSGVFICLIGISYFFICLRMYFWGEANTYPFYIIYGVAAVAFYKTGMSIYGMAVSKQIKNPLLTTMKIIALVDSLVSIVAVQCALIAMEESAETATRSSALLGAGFSVVFLGIGIYMLLRRKVYPTHDEFDIKDKVKKTKYPHRKCDCNLFLNRYKHLSRLTNYVAEWIWQEQLKRDSICRCVCTVTYENGEIHIKGFTDTDFNIEDCVRTAISGYSHQFGKVTKDIPIVCSIQTVPKGIIIEKERQENKI